jgi:hypothetical protein
MPGFFAASPFRGWTSRIALSIRRAPRRPPVVTAKIAQVAQLVEHATENRSVGGSIPPLGTIHPVRSAILDRASGAQERRPANGFAGMAATNGPGQCGSPPKRRSWQRRANVSHSAGSGVFDEIIVIVGPWRRSNVRCGRFLFSGGG